TNGTSRTSASRALRISRNCGSSSVSSTRTAWSPPRMRAMSAGPTSTSTSRPCGWTSLSPHRPRTADSPGQTEARSKEYLALMKGLGRRVPLHYQEPFRRDFGKWQPRAEDYVTDLKGALAGGAASWCWHNGDNRAARDGRPRRSFDLRDKRLFEQLDEEER